nr:1,4-dihydroxy-6-naphthoate synthase [Flavisolibacter sp.]
DTFIFDALVNKRIDTGRYIFEPVLADVEELNKMSFDEHLDITKISIAAYAQASVNYVILDSGSALGKGVGPLLVSRKPIPQSLFPELKVAIPGKFTTANLLLNTFFPELKNKTEIIFSEIESSVLTGAFDAGILIHEGRFTYTQKGLIKLFDLGEIWEIKMNVPLPLGCIAASRKLPANERNEIERLIRESIEYAYRSPDASSHYVSSHSQELSPEVIAQHIALYVNEFSLTLGPEGRAAIAFLLNKGMESGLLPELTQPVFNTPAL